MRKIKAHHKLLILVVRREDGSREWSECSEAPLGSVYERGQGDRPTYDGKDSRLYGKELIDWFNSTCRPGEARREFVDAREATKEEVNCYEKGGYPTFKDTNHD